MPNPQGSQPHAQPLAQQARPPVRQVQPTRPTAAVRSAQPVIAGHAMSHALAIGHAHAQPTSACSSHQMASPQMGHAQPLSSGQMQPQPMLMHAIQMPPPPQPSMLRPGHAPPQHYAQHPSQSPQMQPQMLRSPQQQMMPPSPQQQMMMQRPSHHEWYMSPMGADGMGGGHGPYAPGLPGGSHMASSPTQQQQPPASPGLQLLADATHAEAAKAHPAMGAQNPMSPREDGYYYTKSPGFGMYMQEAMMSNFSPSIFSGLLESPDVAAFDGARCSPMMRHGPPGMGGQAEPASFSRRRVSRLVSDLKV
eukprot:3720240-Pleurochrysis_carterae.AAC.1